MPRPSRFPGLPPLAALPLALAAASLPAFAQQPAQQPAQQAAQEIAQAASPAASPTLSPADTRDYDLPAGPLAATLNRIAREAGLVLTVDAQLVADRRSAPVQGHLDAPSALRQALQGTGLELLPTSAGSYTLRPAAAGAQPVAPAAAAGATQLPAIRVVESAPSATSEGTQAYAARGTTIGKTEQAPKDIPQSVTVLTRQLIDDQHISSLNDLMEQTPGVVVVKDSNAYQAFYSRGLRVDNYQIDGTGIAYGSTYRPDTDLVIYDRVEVLRGAEGLFSGAGEPSGTVNLVRKRPGAQWQRRFSLSAGRWNDYRGELDVGGPLAWDGRLRGRLVAAHRDRDFFYEPADQRSSVLYGVLEVDLGPSTLLSAGSSWQRKRGTHWSYGLPTYADGGDVGFARERALTTPWADQASTIREHFVTLEQTLGPDWTVRLNLLRQEFDVDTLRFVVAGSVDRDTRRFAFASAGFQRTGNHADSVDLNLAGGFRAWGRRHQLVAGLDWRRSRAKEMGYHTSIDTYPEGATLDTDLGGFARPEVQGLRNGWPAYGSTQKGVYAKLQLQATEALRLIVGGRYGGFEHDEPYYTYDTSGAVTSFTEYRYRNGDIFTPYAGVVYALSPDWNAYASVTEIFKPQSNYRAGPPESPTPLDPIRGRNTELGVKGSLLGGALDASLALYRIVRTGEAAEDPAYPVTPGELGSSCCYFAQGRLVSQGVDTELSGRVAPGWQLFAGYTWNQNQNKETQQTFHARTPRHMLKLWSTVELPGELSAWKLGGGVTLRSKQANTGLDWVYDAATGWSQAPFAIRQGGYALWSASLQYRLDSEWSLALNLGNLLDKHYYQTLGTPRGGSWYGEPRNAALTLRGSF